MSDHSNTYTHRETWLNEATRCLAGWFADHGHPLPEGLRLTCGFPSSRAMTANPGKSQNVGECWRAEASRDGTVEVMISPIIAEPVRVMGVLAHELIHAAVGLDVGHKGPFRALAKAIGLEGKMSATTEGDAFKRIAAPILEHLGPYPHAALDATVGRKKQSTRLIKAECGECGYVVRITQKWLTDVGAPHCPNHGEMGV